MSKITIVMVGPDRSVKGGISSVVNVYFSTELVSCCNVWYVSTHIDKNAFFKIFYFFCAIPKIIFRLFNPGVHIVHIHSASRMSFYRKSCVLLLSKLFFKKVIFHIHGGAFFSEFYNKESGEIKKKFIRFILNVSDRIIVLSERERLNVKSMLGGDENILVLKNPIRIPNVPRALYNRGPQVKILFMGKICDAKGVSDLLSTASILLKKGKLLEFVLC